MSADRKNLLLLARRERAEMERELALIDLDPSAAEMHRLLACLHWQQALALETKASDLG